MRGAAGVETAKHVTSVTSESPMQVPSLSPRELDQTFGLTSTGMAEMSCGVTRLQRHSVELMFRLDGVQTLRATREAMGSLSMPEFAAAFSALRDRHFVRLESQDH